MMRRYDGRVIIDISEEQYKELMDTIGYAAGCAIQDSGMTAELQRR